MGIDLATVDSIQGREKDALVLLTTRIHYNPEEGEFLDDPHRINVAFARCRRGQFILGQQVSLVAVPIWDQVLSWANQNGAILRGSDTISHIDTLNDYRTLEVCSRRLRRWKRNRKTTSIRCTVPSMQLCERQDNGRSPEVLT
ncbi:hypothetical protein Q1695_006942 [Nippostrongylus brasiliensis]|nr:hypothetical protein Q1695_006942 [Nippostrongylus brasiliensis]